LSAAPPANFALGAAVFRINPPHHPAHPPSAAASPRMDSPWQSPITMETTMTTDIKSTHMDRIRALNDELRKDFHQGHAVMTTGIAALGAEAVARIVKTIEVYDNFCHANDPYEEHDFGSFEVEGHTIFFKIEYYDPTLTGHSPDPSDPVVTKRVMTIMLAEEY
jgi:hypothetical protein